MYICIKYIILYFVSKNHISGEVSLSIVSPRMAQFGPVRLVSKDPCLALILRNGLSFAISSLLLGSMLHYFYVDFEDIFVSLLAVPVPLVFFELRVEDLLRETIVHSYNVAILAGSL